MKRRYLRVMEAYRTLNILFIAGALFLIFAGESHALITNPRPDLFGPDDHSQIFSPCKCLAALEAYDSADLSNHDGSTFGFFYWGTDTGNPDSLITIFDPTDRFTDGQRDKAAIDFVNGVVYDIDDGYSQQDTFTPITNGYIGFFLDTDDALYSSTLFTVASLNPGGIDAAATFPHLTLSKTYLLGFEIPTSGTVLGFEVVHGLEPVSIPEPQTFILMGFGFLFILVFSLSGQFYRYRDRE